MIGMGAIVSLLIVVGIPTLLLFYMARRFFSFREKQLETEALNAAEKAAQYVARTSELEDRLAVLERIATDRPHALAREIDSLGIAGPSQRGSKHDA